VSLFRSPAHGPGLLQIVIVASLVMSISMGLRQCFGLFMAPMSEDLAVSATTFGLAMALQNIVWGASQPFVGALGDRFGPRPVLLACAAIYALGLALLAGAQDPGWGLNLGIGILTGIGVAGTGFGVLLGAVSRAAPPARRSQLLGIVSGAGSVGILGLAPLGQQLIVSFDWRVTAAAFAAICILMALVSVLIGGRPEEAEQNAASKHDEVSPGLGSVVRRALSHPGFLAMTIAFFACGFQLMFITTHLPRYLGLCGLPPTVAASALGLIGLCNAFGSYACGLLGTHYSQRKLLALIYAVRTVAIVSYLALPITTTSTLVFAAIMGFTWLGVAPLVSGLINRLFGLQNFNMLFGVVFFCHQLGGFAGAWMGGIVLDMTGAYALAWYALVAIGAVAFLLQWSMDDGPRPTARGGTPVVEGAPA
jgi:predicted MFS family arabinose efflux permease